MELLGVSKMEISAEFDKSNKVIFVKVLMTYWHFE